MNKGCFIKSVIVITILVAVVVYIIKYKLDDWVLKPGKKLILNEFVNDWDNEAAYIKDSTEKDSLKLLVKYYLENIKTMEEVVNLDNDIFLSEFKVVIEDSSITKEELSNLTLLLTKE